LDASGAMTKIKVQQCLMCADVRRLLVGKQNTELGIGAGVNNRRLDGYKWHCR